MILKPLTNLRTLSGAALRTYLKFTGSVPTEKRGGPNIVSYLIVKGLLSLGLRDVKLHRLFRRMSEEYAPACFAKGGLSLRLQFGFRETTGWVQIGGSSW